MARSSTKWACECSSSTASFSLPIMKLGIRLIILSNIVIGEAFYLPSFAPVSYCRTDEIERVNKNTDDFCKRKIDVFVNRLNSVATLLPYDYSRFDFCQAPDEVQAPVEKLGQVVFGDRIGPSPYEFTFLKDESCKEVCTKKYNISKDEDKRKVNLIKEGVLFNYQHHWIIDNIPVTWCYDVQMGDYEGVDEPRQYCSPGFPIGCFVDQTDIRKDACVIDHRYGEASSYYIFNHLNIEIEYHTGNLGDSGDTPAPGEEWGVARLVRAKITPYSIRQVKNDTGEVTHCSTEESPSSALSFSDQTREFEITYTYNVTFIENDEISWASRWDYLLDSMSHNDVEWFSIINSLVIVLFLTGSLVTILVKSLRKGFTSDPDIYMFSNINMKRGHDLKWLLVSGDVFRPPRTGGWLLSAFLGTGVQIIVTVFITLFWACTGFLSPACRGCLMNVALYTFALLGLPAGYVASRMYRTFAGKCWKSIAMLTSFLIPGIIFGVFSLLNLILWGEGSSAAIPYSTIIALLALWFCISTPLVFIGSYFGFKQRPLKFPVSAKPFPRLIPRQPFLCRPLLGIIMGGILPFACIFIQLFFILNSLWSHQVYYMFGFLTLVALILVVTCFEVTIVLCYLHLNAEDYRWWWRSFLTSGFSAFYFLVYCINYFWSRLELHGLASKMLYFGYTFIMVMLFFLFCGTIGFFACLFFLMMLYSLVREETDDPAPEDPVSSTEKSNRIDLSALSFGAPGYAKLATPDEADSDQEELAAPDDLPPVADDPSSVPLVVSSEGPSEPGREMLEVTTS